MRREKPGAPAGLGYRVRRLVVGDGRASRGRSQAPQERPLEALKTLVETLPTRNRCTAPRPRLPTAMSVLAVAHLVHEAVRRRELLVRHLIHYLRLIIPRDPRVQVREFLVVFAERAPVVKTHESGENEPGYCQAHHCQHEEQKRVRYSSLLCLSSIS